MELAIPLLALGGMYVISNQSKPSNNSYKFKDDSKPGNLRENYTNMGQHSNYLPNTTINFLDHNPVNMKDWQKTALANGSVIKSEYYRDPTINVVTSLLSNANTYLTGLNTITSFDGGTTGQTTSTIAGATTVPGATTIAGASTVPGVTTVPSTATTSTVVDTSEPTTTAG